MQNICKIKNKLSTNGFAWHERPFNERLKETIKQKFRYDEIISKAVASRYGKLENIDQYINPKITDVIPDPYHLHGLEDAVKHIAEMILCKKKIGIFGDYDVDGATSTALLHRYLEDIGHLNPSFAEHSSLVPSDTKPAPKGFYKCPPHITFHIPDRIKEGYGPNEKALQKFKDDGVELCVLVDCGTVAYLPLKFAKSIGLNVVIVDHHISNETLPEALAVINPNRYDQNSDCTNLAAVGVVFLLLVGLNRYLQKELNYFVNNNTRKPDLSQYLDLVALGTVCDIVPITGINRAFVKQGLKILNGSKNEGIEAMVKHLNSQKRLDVVDLGFAIGPRINAGGRIGNPSIGATLLTSRNSLDCYELCQTLTDLNNKRKIVEEEALKWAIREVEKTKPSSVVIISGDWHPGVSGLIASRIKDIYNLPTFAISFYDGDKIGKASGRSIHGVDMGTAILRAKEKNLVIEGGGHAMAGGFSTTRDNLDELEKFFEKVFSEQIETLGFHAIKYYDSIITINQINSYLYESLAVLEPFGSGNPQMKFLLQNVKVYDSKVFGQSGTHITCKLEQNGSRIKCNSFGNAIRNSCRDLLNNPKNISILGSISLNLWNGKDYYEFLAEDINLE